jgi:pyruvate,water dikinase
VGAARGLATGRALVLRHGQEPSEVPAGAVVVARILHPHLAPLLLRAGAVVVEEGAVLQHATTLAREFGLAAVVGVRGATEAIQDGEWLEVDGDRGLVRRLGVATAGEGPK